MQKIHYEKNIKEKEERETGCCWLSVFDPILLCSKNSCFQPVLSSRATWPSCLLTGQVYEVWQWWGNWLGNMGLYIVVLFHCRAFIIFSALFKTIYTGVHTCNVQLFLLLLFQMHTSTVNSLLWENRHPICFITSLDKPVKLGINIIISTICSFLCHFLALLVSWKEKWLYYYFFNCCYCREVWGSNNRIFPNSL